MSGMMSKAEQKEKEEWLKAVARNGYALKRAPLELRADREVVGQAVAQNGYALKYASDDLRADREVVMKAVAEDGDALEYASEALRADRGFVLEAVAQDGYALGSASRELRADREVALQAVARNGDALEWASEELCADREVALQAVRSSGYSAWRYVDKKLLRDPDIIRAREACTSGLTQCTRITFPGRLPSGEGGQCAASFPGAFAEKWDELTKQRTDLSVACVFLTRPEDGLGKHGSKCMCHRLYPQVSPETYLAIMEKPQSEEEDRDYEKNLAFCKADAKAMGQVLIEEKAHPTEAAWEKAKQEARKTAQKLWEENDRRPPWGCRWFEMWKDNIEMAIKFKQELLVYFFPGKKGKGKVSWDKLNDEAIVQQALRDNGLGASQRAEVAWLDFMGYKYVELDVANF